MSTDRELDKEGIYMRYYSTNRKNEIMPFVASWVDLEISTLNEVKERQIPYYVSHMWNIIFLIDTSELIYKTETDLQILKTNLWLPKGKSVCAGGGWKDKTGV